MRLVLSLSVAIFSAAALASEPTTQDTIADWYRPAAKRIMAAAMEGNDAWNKLEELCDGIGHRLSGSPQLEEAIEWAAEAMREDGQESVRNRSLGEAARTLGGGAFPEAGEPLAQSSSRDEPGAADPVAFGTPREPLTHDRREPEGGGLEGPRV